MLSIVQCSLLCVCQIIHGWMFLGGYHCLADNMMLMTSPKGLVRQDLMQKTCHDEKRIKLD